MIVSHQKRFIFVHINKAAGTSVKTALKPYADVWHRKYTLRRLLYVMHLAGPVGDHSTALEIREKFGPDVFDNYFKFAFVRNPWDWQVSQYHYILSHVFHPHHWTVRSLPNFSAFVTWAAKNDKVVQKHYVTDSLGNLLVDYLGRFENLNEDFTEICRLIGVENPLPRKNTSPHKDYTYYYDQETMKFVAEHYREDIEMFSYNFGE